MTIRDTMGRVFQPGFIADIPTGNLLWVDAVNGNNDLAVRGRMTVPFKTLTKAKEAAVSGDTIMVLPGTYNEKNLLKNGVNWHFLPGAKVIYSGTAAGGIFDTSGDGNGTDGGVISMITGWGEFQITEPTTAGHVVYSAAGYSELFIEAKKMVSYNSACVKRTDSGGILNIQVMEGIDSSTGRVVEIGGGTQTFIRAYRLYTSGGAGLYVSAGSVILEAQFISSSADSAVSIAGGSGSNIVVRAYEIYAGTKSAVYYNASSNPTLTILGARIVSGGGTAADGRAVHIENNSLNVIKLANCVLVASAAATESIYSPLYSPSKTRIHTLNGYATNKPKHSNVSQSGGSESLDSTIS